ncbi:BPL-N domain-containing protein [Streptomyces niveus]|uniref:BPL-N domain-containing protein n=1 Tax=Streptomyces niveus TaxID=193462 RepID=A0ABZ1ZVP2_STRNV|nr:BPL-N domain-containing protein [Streptomyces niveus]
MPGRDLSSGPRPTTADRRRLLLGVLPAAALLAAGCARSNGDEPTEERPLALVYNGPQGCSDCAPTIASLLRRAPQPFRVRYVGPGTGVPLTAGVLADARLYVQPGGGSDLDGVWRVLRGSAGMMRDWVQGGGSYLGLCFGGYLAGRNPGFDLLPGDTNGYIDLPDTTIHDDRDTVVPVKWRGKRRYMYFQDGPAFLLDHGADADVLATYPNGAAAVVVAPYGRGRVGVSGPHPEADRSWYEDAGLKNPDGVRFDLANELIEKTVGKQ